MAGGSDGRAGPDPPRPLAAWRPTAPLRAYQEEMPFMKEKLVLRKWPITIVFTVIETLFRPAFIGSCTSRWIAWPLPAPPRPLARVPATVM